MIMRFHEIMSRLLFGGFGCKEVYLSTGPDIVRAKHVYEKIGFRSENRMVDDEELFTIVLD